MSEKIINCMAIDWYSKLLPGSIIDSFGDEVVVEAIKEVSQDDLGKGLEIRYNCLDEEGNRVIGCELVFDKLPDDGFSLEPISVTERLLHKLGFDYSGVFFNKRLGDCIVMVQVFNDRCDVILHDDSSMVTGVKVNYLHELQGVCLMLKGISMDSFKLSNK